MIASVSLAQEFAQLHFDQRGRAQLQQQGAHFGECATRELAQFGEAFFAFAAVAVQQAWKHFCNQGSREQCLCHGIMQVASDAAAFLGHGRALDLRAQARVFDGERRLIADGGGKLDLLGGEFARFSGNRP